MRCFFDHYNARFNARREKEYILALKSLCDTEEIVNMQ